MAGRGTINRQVQIGVESTPGTPVAASKTLPTLSLNLTRVIEKKEYRSQGFKPVTADQIIKDYGTGSMSGPLDYFQVIYPLNSLVTGVITTPGGGTTSRDHTFTPAATGADAFKTFTIQEGDSTAARQMAYSIFSEFSVTTDLTTAEVAGSIVGRTPTTATLTGSPTAVSLLPANIREIDLFMDTTFAGIGTTKVTDATRAFFSITSKYALKWVLNTSETSFKDIVETAPTLAFSFTTEDNAQSRALYDAVSTNPVRYMRLKATGAIIEGAIPYKFQLDAGVHISATAQEDVEGVWSYRYDCLPIYTTTFPGAWAVVVTNTLTAL
jgi:hypothetical protein